MFESDEKALLPGLAPASTERRAHRLFYALVSYTKHNLRPLLLASFALTSVFLFLRPTTIPHLSRQFATERSDILNSTLGFEKVLAISFPERTDKRDVLLLASSFVGFDIDWIPGVAYEDISAKAAPANWDYASRSNGSLGCWRAHMNALQHIVQNRIQTALIMEDDSDFDINLKSQLLAFAEGARVLQSRPSATSVHASPSSFSPYGSNWDMLWVGHCRLGPREDQRDFYVFENDPTVPPQGHRHGIWQQDRIPRPLLMANSTRVVFRATNGGVCTGGYAVTYDGARKMLSAVSVHPQDDAVDISFRKFCQGKLGVKPACIGVYPTLFGSHRTAGPSSRDSDLNEKGDSWHKEYTWDVVYSTMQNVLELSDGAEAITAQWQESQPRIWEVGRKLELKGSLVEWDMLSLERSAVEGINRST